MIRPRDSTNCSANGCLLRHKTLLLPPCAVCPKFDSLKTQSHMGHDASGLLLGCAASRGRASSYLSYYACPITPCCLLLCTVLLPSPAFLFCCLSAPPAMLHHYCATCLTALCASCCAALKAAAAGPKGPAVAAAAAAAAAAQQESIVTFFWRYARARG